ncbi:hypothetical protein ZIOFF_049327 [Zingiber officinale]|uniref:Ribosomal protein eL8/eL30/eS12/Gadd45 domain-containing protein n=1 Tax=Zingiber officinale TaxID=94328 RepID=A0A8J5FSN2_ZINOF|nr:hypothetical protein ZIOFF_049327 [Zingiber officinale]
MGSDSENEKSVKERKKLMAVAPIAKPLAGRKLCKRTLKLVRRVYIGRRLCIIAGNISPIDVITHVPILLEEADIPYIYVPSKEDLAVAGVTKRPTCCVLVTTKPTKGDVPQEVQEKLQSDYNQVIAEAKELTASLF